MVHFKKKKKKICKEGLNKWCKHDIYVCVFFCFFFCFFFLILIFFIKAYVVGTHLNCIDKKYTGV